MSKLTDLLGSCCWYYWLFPTGQKIANFLEESSLPYMACPGHKNNGEKRSPEYTGLSSNRRMTETIDNGVG